MSRNEYSKQLHYLKPMAYWAVPYDSEADKEVAPAVPVVIQQEGQAVRVCLGGFGHYDRPHDVADLHIELDKDGQWTIAVHPDAGDPAIIMKIGRYKRGDVIPREGQVSLLAEAGWEFGPVHYPDSWPVIDMRSPKYQGKG